MTFGTAYWAYAYTSLFGFFTTILTQLWSTASWIVTMSFKALFVYKWAAFTVPYWTLTVSFPDLGFLKILVIAIFVYCVEICISNYNERIEKIKKAEMRQRARYYHYCYNFYSSYQNDVRRQWLRGIYALTDGTSKWSRAVRDDEKVLQLMEFFKMMPGLRRQMGAIMALYYDPPSAEDFVCSVDKYSVGEVVHSMVSGLNKVDRCALMIILFAGEHVLFVLFTYLVHRYIQTRTFDYIVDQFIRCRKKLEWVA